MLGSKYSSIAPVCACGNTVTKFFLSGKPGKFCEPCRDKQRAKTRSPLRNLRCAHCDCAFQSTAMTGPERRYCSDLCKGRAKYAAKRAAERTHECAQCKAVFTADHKKKYCSAKCKVRARTLRLCPTAATAESRTAAKTCQCKKCGKQYQNKHGGKTGEGSTYCSRDCAFNDQQEWRRRDENADGPTCSVHFKDCKHCGKPWTSRRSNTSVCSIDCFRAITTAKANSANRDACGTKPSVACKCCSKEFTPTYGDKRKVFCSDACSTRLARRARGSGSHRSRAIKAGVAHEFINRLKVFQRDGWKCQICGIRTPQSKIGKFVDNAPELDHRVPLSKGGAHLYSNVQCACRKCNGDKSNNSSAGQLPMFEIEPSKRGRGIVVL